MAKKFNPNRKPANLGVAFVQKIVDEMDCVWRPTPNDDVGLDGEIELGKDGAATARLIKVQVKSGKSYFHKETATRFEFIAKPDDLEYWSRANLPVILVVYDPEKGEGYWKHIQRFLSDNPGSITKARHIPFSKRKDRLVVGTFVQLCNLVFDDEAVSTNGSLPASRLFPGLIRTMPNWITSEPPTLPKLSRSARIQMLHELKIPSALLPDSLFQW